MLSQLPTEPPIPSVISQALAALAFVRNLESVVFNNPRQWSVDNLFVATSVWDIPLLKPRFGCNFDLGLSLLGYDLSERVAREFESFKLGHKCETGFRAVDLVDLKIKSNREFGVEGALEDMPDLQQFRVSVIFCAFADEAKLFEMSVQTVIAHFPSAHEVLVVVVEEDEALFEDIVDGYRASAPFPLRVISEPADMDGHLQMKYFKVRFAFFNPIEKYFTHFATLGVRIYFGKVGHS